MNRRVVTCFPLALLLASAACAVGSDASAPATSSTDSSGSAERSRETDLVASGHALVAPPAAATPAANPTREALQLTPLRPVATPQTRTLGSNQAIYDIAITSILASNTLHASDTSDGQVDPDHLYFAVAGGAGNLTDYQGSFNGANQNFYANIAQGTTASNASFVIPNLPIETGDTIQIALLMDSRANATLASQLASWQTQEVNYAQARAQGLDPGALPASVAAATGGTNNWPIWLWPNAGASNEEINPNLTGVATAGVLCDGYTGDLTTQINVGSLLAALPNGAASGSTWTFTEKLAGDYPIECWSANTLLDPNAEAAATVTFTVTLHYTPPPVLSVCDVTSIVPVDANESSTVSPLLWQDFYGKWEWNGANDANVTAQISPGYAATVSETSSNANGCIGTAAFSQSESGLPAVWDSADTTYTEVDPACQFYYTPIPIHPIRLVDEPRPETAGISRFPIIRFGNPALQFTAQTDTVNLQLFQETCSNGDVGQYHVLYTRTNSSGTVLTEEMLNYTALLQ